jgi:hypothetical protein
MSPIQIMRVISSLLVPFFLSFTCVVQAENSVSWHSADCDETEADFSLDVIGEEVLDNGESTKCYKRRVTDKLF